MANGMMTTIRYEGVQPIAGQAGHAGHTGSTSHTSAGTAQTGHAAHTSAAGGSATQAIVAEVPQGATKVVMTDNRYQPASVTVAAGTTVAWINSGANVHTVSAFDGSVESGAIPPGKAFVHTFTKPGTYQLLCRQHLLNGMTASVIVQ